MTPTETQQKPLVFVGEVIAFQKTGLIRIQHERIIRQFQFQEGHCVAASTNAKSELPGPFLEKLGVLSSEQTQVFFSQMAVPKANLWGIVTQLANLEAGPLGEYRSKWVSMLAGQLGRMSLSKCLFQEQEPKPNATFLLEGIRFLIEGCQALTPEQLSALNPRLTPENKIFVDEKIEKKLSPLPLDAEERGLLTVVRDNDDVREVFESSFIGEEKIRRLLHAFSLAHLISLEDASEVEQRNFEASLSPDALRIRQELLALHKNMASTTYYEWLEVSNNDTPSAIQEKGNARLEFLANPSHEQLFQTHEKSILEELLKSIVEALQVLCDPLKRKEYDFLVAKGKTGSVHIESAEVQERDILISGKQKEDENNFQVALSIYERGLKSLPNSDSIIAAFTRLLLKTSNGKDTLARDKALKWIQEALKRKSTHFEIFESLGNWMLLLNRPEKATEAFSRALQLNPWSFQSHQRLRDIAPHVAGPIAIPRILRLQPKKNFYEMLGVSQKASPKDIQAAYRQCTKYFHPDRFFQTTNEELKTQAKDIYKRMVEAYMTLKNPSKRQSYDQSLLKMSSPASPQAKETTSDEPQTLQAKKYLQLALMAQKEGKLDTAKMNLKLGMQIEPTCTAFSRFLNEWSS